MNKLFSSKKIAATSILLSVFILIQCVPIVLSFENYEVGLIAHWQLDEDYWNGTPYEVIDSSGNGNHGTAQNGVTTVDGLVGKCGDFDGINDRIVFPNDLNTRPTSQITVMSWINPEKVYTSGDWHYDDPIIGKRWAYYLYINHNGYLCFGFYNTRYNPTTAVIGPYLKPYEGKWIHVAATYDGSYTRIYLNGELVKQEARSGPINDDTTLPFISYIDYTRYFDGLIDEAMIYNRALDSAEINQYFQEIFTQNLGSGQDQTINEGETATFEATKIQPNPSTGLIFSWDFNNDGVYDYQESPSSAPDGLYDGKIEKVYPNEGVFIVNLKISDSNGVLKTDESVITVNNVAPQTTILSGLGIADNYIFVTQTSDSLSYFIDIFEDGTFSTPEYVDNKADSTYGAGVGDFDNDGDLDALIGDRYDTWYYEKTGDGNSFAPAVSIDSKDYNHRMDFAEADFDNDGNLDAIMTTFSNYEYTFYKGNGDGTFIITRFSAPYGNIGMDAADFNNDGNMDFVAAGWGGTRSINLYLGNGDGTFQAPTAIVSYVQSWGVSAADFNNDGNVDIIYGLFPKFYSGNGDGTFGSGINLGISSVYAMAESDIDGDGNTDFVYTDGLTYVKCSYGDGAGTFSHMDYVYVPTIYVRGIATSPETGGILEVNEGENIDFEGTFSDEGWLDTHTATWNWGDTSPTETGTVTEENIEPFSTGSVTGSHAFGDNGKYTITLTVTDDYGDKGIDTTQIIVLNVVPIADPGDDITTYEGTQIEFDGSASYDPGYLDILTFEWDFGDGNSATGETPTHIFENEGIYTVTLTVTDDDAGSDTETLVVTVLDAYPYVDFDWTPEIQDEFSPIQFTDQTSSYDPIVAWAWDFAGIGTSTETNPEFTFFDDGIYSVTLTVTDDDGSTNQISYAVTVLDLVPAAEFSWTPEPQNEGSSIQFTDLSTSAPDEIVAWSWDFAGIGTSNEKDATFTFLDNGIYTVVLSVTDDDSSSSTISNHITINNVIPIVDAGEEQTVNEGDSVSFVGSFSDAGSDDTHTTVWNFGDETTETDTLTPTHVYADDGIYMVTLTVTDDDGGVGQDTLTLTVENVAPSANAGEDQVTDETIPISFLGTANDPGLIDTLTFEWDFDYDGTIFDVEAIGQTATFTWSDDWVGIVAFRVTDDDGAFSIDTLNVQVKNVAPSADAGIDQTCAEGDNVNFEGLAFDQSPDDTLTFTWNFGDGNTETGTLTPTHVYGDNDEYMVTLSVEDDDGAITTNTLTVSVTNVAPVLSEICATYDPVAVNSEIAASATFTDAGILDTHTAVWDWGDETISVGRVTEEGGVGEIVGNHTYESAGIYTIILTLDDDDGASVFDAFRHIVVYDTSAGFVTGGGWIMSPEGAYLEDTTLTGRATFGFVAKYKKGTFVPTGNTEFISHEAGLNFHSISYEWLVITGNTAKYTGTGTIKGMEGEYAFTVTVTEGNSKDTADLFRIKIWDKSTDQVIYDNNIDSDDNSNNGTEIEGGTIKIHTPKKEEFKVKEEKAEKSKAKK